MAAFNEADDLPPAGAFGASEWIDFVDSLQTQGSSGNAAGGGHAGVRRVR